MMNVLPHIIESKKVEIERKRTLVSIDELTDSPLFMHKTIVLSEILKLTNIPCIIAEFKRKSPSKGIINNHSIPENVAMDYRTAGAAAISILTDTEYFGGNFADFYKVREIVSLPLLRKDFIIDEYQVYETKSIGADVMLLIAAILSVKQCVELSKIGKDLGLDILLEIHNEEELGHINPNIDIVGVNNRNLKTFEVNLQHSIQLSKKIPDSFVKIAESGISNPKNVQLLHMHGFRGFLIGENFMKTNDPGATCQAFIDELFS